MFLPNLEAQIGIHQNIHNQALGRFEMPLRDEK
jgi:hypothetical protein